MQAYIYDHVRTPRGKGRADGALHEVTPTALIQQTLEALRDRNALDTQQIEDVVLGVVMPVGEQGANLARTAALAADYHEGVPGYQVNRFCASGLEALNIGSARIASGECDAIVAGGVECMSRVPIASDGGACYTDPDAHWRSWYVPQGIGADLIATMDGYDREELDAFAVQSHHRAAFAWGDGRFDGSVVPIRDILGEVLLDKDETVRPDTSVEKMAALKPAFEKLGTGIGFDDVILQRYPAVEAVEHRHTAANSSGIVDGATAMLIGSEAYGVKNAMTPRGRVVGYASIGCEPAIMLTGPADATRRVLAKAGLGIDDIDLFEVNEAFASVVLRFARELGVEEDRINVNGGAIAMGHPLGATGAILVGTLLDELERRNLRRGIVTLCAASGMATATIIERV